MHLKVGELARSTGLTVRTLHHYDEIGLLEPSGRSDAGYRLYSEADVARLHAIQALRYLGLPLADIAPLLDGEQASMDAILAQQMQALQQQIRQATELHDRLALVRDTLLAGKRPDVRDWVQVLSLMTTYGKYFSAAEIQAILGAWTTVEREWGQLLVEVRAHMDAGGAIDNVAGQALCRRWMLLMHRWMGGDLQLMERWGAMYRSEPAAYGVRGAPPRDMIEWMERAIEFRVGLLRAHFDEGDIGAFVHLPDAEWQAIEADGRALLDAGAVPDGPAARALLARWVDLLGRAAGGHGGRARRLQTQHLGHPLLLAGAPVSREVREFLWTTQQALDPHAT